MERLDKILSRELHITRSEAKQLIRSGAVSLNGVVCCSADTKCLPEDCLTVHGKVLESRRHVYIMLNKPKGVISASDGKNEKTVIDLLPEEMKRRGLFPAGRLDRDTTGFVLLTDDGAFAHEILSPSRHIDKTYIAVLDKPITPAVIEDFRGGMLLGSERLLAAELSPVDGDNTRVRVVLRQGLYHQIKRMFKKHGITVQELKRIRMGALALDERLQEGEARYLTEEEREKIVLRSQG